MPALFDACPRDLSQIHQGRVSQNPKETGTLKSLLQKCNDLGKRSYFAPGKLTLCYPTYPLKLCLEKVAASSFLNITSILFVFTFHGTNNVLGIELNTAPRENTINE